MDKQPERCFEALIADREENIKVLEKPSMRGVINSVVEKYSDQAHFIYELLQNADDAKATSARFVLFKDKLLFIHNGTKRFNVSNPATEEHDRELGTLGDINSITSIGASNKTDETTIGKFGLGFKAVFQYTLSPSIYDPDIFFKIKKFIVPTLIDDDYTDYKREPNETLFVFPFDQKELISQDMFYAKFFDQKGRDAEEAYADISDKLCSLDYPLLFLSNLKNISYQFSGLTCSYRKKTEKQIAFDTTTAEFIRLSKNNGENRDESCDRLWLFSRGKGKKDKYSVGFFVDAESRLIPKTHSAFCFFPTRETTGVKFIIHAPFLLTDSREGIRTGVSHNVNMITLLSMLAADSLVYLKEIGKSERTILINDNIFDIIPYDEGSFDSKETISFKPFYTAIHNAFRTEWIIPSIVGYVNAKNAFWASVPQIAKLFTNKQLALLCENEEAKWAFPSFGRNNTRDTNKKLTAYIDAITETYLDEYDILEDKITPEFIEMQPIKWLHSFYKWISETEGRREAIYSKPIFLNQDGKAVAAFDDNGQEILFLPTEDGSGYETINEALLENKKTYSFLRQIGIREPTVQNEIYTQILPQYQDGVPINTRPHFKKFFRYYQECSNAEAKRLLDMIRDYEFILYASSSNKKQYRGKPNELYFPFENLQQWFQFKSDTKFVSFDEYLELVGEDKKEELVTFLTDLGVKDVPRVLSHKLAEKEAREIQRYWSYSSWGQSWHEKYIDGLKEYMENVVSQQSIEMSRLLWSELLKFVQYGYFKERYYQSKESVLYGRYDYFYYKSKSEHFESSTAKWLRTKPWLVDGTGSFVSVKELTVQTMNIQYDLSCDEAIELIRILGIMEEIEVITDEDASEKFDIISLGESLGLSEDEQRQALKDFAKYKKETAKDSSNDENDDDDFFDDGNGEGNPVSSKSVKRVAKEVTKRATAKPEKHAIPQNADVDDMPTDEDDYTKATVDISKKVEKIKKRAERDIQEIARLEDLRQSAQNADKYSYAWFNALLELEAINSGEDNANSREISISFSKVEREEGTARTLILKHPNRYIPQSMEDLADIPLELHFAHQPMVKVAVEVVNVRSYTLRAKLRTGAQIDGVDLTQISEARIVARNPVFLIEELRKAFIKLGDDNDYDEDFNMLDNLCENIEFVFGPPGTGKTTHLARNLILPKMSEVENLKVLVLTPTNKAADVLTRRLIENIGNDHSYRNWLVRFGATNDSVVEQSGVFRDKTFDIRSFSRNVTVTTIARFPYDYFLPDSSTRLHLNALKWDYIIIDEASMIPLVNIIYPLYKKTPNKFIIAGDPFQIEPITKVDEWKNENIYTMVKLNSFTKPTTIPYQYHVQLLTTQYRSIPEIGEIFSKFAYGGVLEHFRSTDSQRNIPIGDFIDLTPLNIIKFPVKKYESIYRPKQLQQRSSYQVYSALFAFEFLMHLTSLIESASRNELFRIGLIAPYRAQSDLIDKLMASAELPKNIDIQVGTIHGFQGDECDIILALFNTPPKISSSKEMFLNKLNIVNVSISRARDYLFILMPDDETENVDNLSLIKKVEHLCKSQHGWSEQQSQNLEESIFGSRTYIEDHSFSTSHQLVNVYGLPEKRYEVRSEDNAIDVQVYMQN